MGLIKRIGRGLERAARPLVKRGIVAGGAGLGAMIGGPVGGMIGEQITTGLVTSRPRGTGGGGISVQGGGVEPAAYMASNGHAPTGSNVPAPRQPGGRSMVPSGVVYILIAAAARLGLNRLTLQAAMAILRKFGIVAGATLLTLSAQEALLVWMAGTKRPRRRKGISARDVRTVSRAQSIVRRAQRLADAFPSTRAPARRRRARAHAAGCSCVVCKRG